MRMTRPDWCDERTWAMIGDMADTIILTREADGQSASYAMWLRECIARAIMAERERAAEKATAVGKRFGEPAIGHAIAAAIRKGDAS